MGVLNEVLGKSVAPEPTMRDDAEYVTEITLRAAPGMHALTALGSNGEETDDTRLPAPEHPLLTRMDDVRLSEVIEKHIDFVDDNGRSVHLGAGFVRHFQRRSDGALPLVRAVATLPMVLPNGDILSGHGLNREIGVVFRVQPELQALIPDIKDCTPTAVANDMQFLIDVWLCDVACDYISKCVLLASVATILERLLLPERPAFFFDAGQRGSGKTTAATWSRLPHSASEPPRRLGPPTTRNVVNRSSRMRPRLCHSSCGTISCAASPSAAQQSKRR